jgi:hypothetical protein
MENQRSILTALVVMLGVAGARADELPRGDVATANALFVEGKRLYADGQFTEACTKFEASMTLVPRLGVQLNLADCYELAGKTASAWVVFGEAAARARRLADSREQFARQRQDALVPRLCSLNIKLAMSSSTLIRGLAVTRDGAQIEPSAYGLDVPVDPGVHLVEVTAPGWIPWSTRVVVVAEGEVVAVSVPDLARRTESPATTPIEHTANSGRRHTTPATWILAGAGAAGIGVGATLGYSARSLWREARPGCSSSNVCAEPAFRLVERSRREGNLSTIAFAIGGAALAAGFILYVRTPREHDEPVQVAPAIAPSAAGIRLAGRF